MFIYYSSIVLKNLNLSDPLFWNSLLTQGLAGIQPIDVPGIENVRSLSLSLWHEFLGISNDLYATLQVDVTDLIEGHSSYLWTTQQILELLELDTYYPVFRATKPKQ